MIAIHMPALKKALVYLVSTAVVVFTSVLIGLMVGIGLWKVAAGLIGLVALNMLFIWYTGRNPGNRDILFWMMLVLVLTVGFIQKHSGTSFGFLLELVMLLAMPYAIGAFVSLDARLKRLFLLLIIFLVITISSAFFGESSLFVSVFQIGTDLKFVILLLIGFYITWSKKTEQRFWFAVRWLWLPFMLLVAWQWIAPGSYFKYIQLNYSGQADPLGVVPTRALGPYNHSATFAAVLSLLFLISISRALTQQKFFFFVACAYFLLLLGTTQRLEILSLLGIVSVLYIYYGLKGQGIPGFLKGMLSIFVILVTVVSVFPSIENRLERDTEFREFTGEIRAFRPRPVYYTTSFTIANQRFPFGSGPGTFASAGAGKFNWSYYQKLGFFSYPWFSPTFLFETYWPHFIAEAGWFGFLAYFLFVLGLIRYSFHAFKAATEIDERMYWLIATTSLAYLLLTSFNGPTFEDPATALLAVPFVGIAHRFTRARLSGQMPKSATNS